MICPVDKNDMIVVEHKKIELDYCTKCRGVWFDSGELELLLESMKLNRREFMDGILKSPEAKTSEAKRKCPLCRQDMRKTNVGKPEITIDVCPKGEGLWFDGGEVGQLLEQLDKESSAGKSGHGYMTGFLKEVFKGTR
ncbi:MAG: zf-TFIIB domain-containing protein [Dehalococcoidales bacterium]|nr:zf-TFIIB domain-containing protein [Dehalococcoidales bacterium]